MARSKKGVAQETNLVPEVSSEETLVLSGNMVEVEEVSAPSLPSLLSQAQAMTEAVPEVRKTKSVKNENVWGNVRMLFDQGLTNKEVLSQIHEMYGNTNTSYACIAWYRNKYSKLAKSDKMTVEQLLNQVACQFGMDQDWIKSQVAKL